MTDRLEFTQGQLFHMTLIERLPAIIAAGRLLCDAALGELAGQSIAMSTSRTGATGRGPRAPWRCVGDYVPFYLAPRSPMLAANHYGKVEGRTPGRMASSTS